MEPGAVQGEDRCAELGLATQVAEQAVHGSQLFAVQHIIGPQQRDALGQALGGDVLQQGLGRALPPHGRVDEQAEQFALIRLPTDSGGAAGMGAADDAIGLGLSGAHLMQHRGQYIRRKGLEQAGLQAAQRKSRHFVHPFYGQGCFVTSIIACPIGQLACML